jgi:hypothetical protein
MSAMHAASIHALAVALLATAAPARARPQAPAADAPTRLGPQLVVAGTPVTDEMLQLWIVYGPAREKLEHRKVRWLIDRELEARGRAIADERVREAAQARPFESKAAEDAAREEILRAVRKGFETTTLDVEDVIAGEYEHALADFAQRFPNLDAQTEMRRSMRSGDWFRDQLRWTKIFDRVFLPDDAATRPEATKRALRARYKGEYETMAKPWRGADGKIDPQYKLMVRQAVRDELFLEQHFVTSLEGPDFSVALRADVDGDGTSELTIRTADMWREVESTVAAEELEDARRYWSLVLATRASMAREKILLSKEARDQAWFGLKEQLHEFVPTLDALALVQERFPSTETYREFHGLVRSMRTHIEPELAPGKDGALSDALRADLPRADPRLSGVRVDAEVLLLSGYDFPKAAWKPEGTAGALERARALADSLRASAASRDDAWKRALDEKSEWWDPPVVAEPGDIATDFFRKNKGRFGPREWTELVELLDLTRYELWVRGTELADALLFQLPVGEIGGPYPCRWGACLVRVKSRTAPARPVDPKQAAQRSVLELEYLDERLRRYSRAALAMAREDAKPKK